MTKVSIIIVTYNGMAWIDKCLSSCGNYPVVVVDNSSTDATVSYIKENYPDVILFEQSENLGFGQANNIGIRYALQQGADHVFLLNQDAYILDNALELLIDFQIKNPIYGIVSPLHFKKDEQTFEDMFEFFFLKDKMGKINGLPITPKSLDTFYEMRFINAAAWLVSRECMETVGGFDPIFFHYGEDDNYCQRVLYHGFKIAILSKAHIVHYGVNQKKVIKPYSKEYYKISERKYKVRYANVGAKNNSLAIDKQLKKLRNQCIKDLLNGGFRNSYGKAREFLLLKRIKKSINTSLVINKSKGPNYLALSN